MSIHIKGVKQSSRTKHSFASLQSAVIFLLITAPTRRPSTAVAVQPHTLPRKINNSRLGCAQGRVTSKVRDGRCRSCSIPLHYRNLGALQQVVSAVYALVEYCRKKLQIQNSGSCILVITKYLSGIWQEVLLKKIIPTRS